MPIKVEVLKYLPSAMNCDYDDGSFEWFDGTKLRVVSPADAQGKTLMVYHNTAPPEGSPWRATGSVLELDMTVEIAFPNRLGHSVHHFSDGIKILSISNAKQK